MINIVLTHTGPSQIPSYTKECLKQVRFTNPGASIFYLSEEKNFTEDYAKLFFDLSITAIDICGYQQEDERYKEFLELSWYKVWGIPNTTYPSPKDFVQGTSERIHAMDAFLRDWKLNDVWHFENDNMIYSDLDKITNATKKFAEEKICMPELGKYEAIFNITFIEKPQILTEACDFLLSEMKKGNDQIRKENPGIEMVHEMSLFRVYDQRNNNIKFLPTMPIGPQSYGIDELGLFDPAGYGQFLGGTNNGHGPGFIDEKNHFIGPRMKQGKFYPVYFHDRTGNGPHVHMKCDDGIWDVIPLHNLHVHCKQLEKFETYGDYYGE